MSSVNFCSHVKWLLLQLLILASWTYSEKRSTSVKLFQNTPCRLVITGTCPDPDVRFFLYTRENSTKPQVIDINEGVLNLTSSNFNPKHETKVIIHGYNSDMHLDVLQDIRKAYLDKGDYNIIFVDWAKLVMFPCYPTAVYNARFAGKCIAQLLQELRLLGSTEFHVVGFSLGAHVAGFVANYLRPYKLPRITGLDPAMPFFVTVNKENKLDADDAEFVDVIHTNSFVQGKIEASGDVDFYVNGGMNQPGCWNEPNPFGCDHHRAPAYFAESINSKEGFYGWACSGFIYYLIGLCPPRQPSVLMGDRVPFKTRGFYLVTTAAEKPFALGPWLVSPLDDIRSRKRDKHSGANDVNKYVNDMNNYVNLQLVESLWTKPEIQDLDSTTPGQNIRNLNIYPAGHSSESIFLRESAEF